MGSPYLLLTLIIIYYDGKARSPPWKYNIKVVFCPRTSLSRDPSEELSQKETACIMTWEV